VNISLVQLNAKGTRSSMTCSCACRAIRFPASCRWQAASTAGRTLEGTLSNTRFQTPVGPVALTRNRAGLPQSRAENQHRAALLDQPERRAVRAADHRRGRQRAGAVNLNRFDLAMLKPFMPEATQASGVFSGNADVSWDTTKEGLPQGK
jgi:translocation and assembly module TamB